MGEDIQVGKLTGLQLSNKRVSLESQSLSNKFITFVANNLGPNQNRPSTKLMINSLNCSVLKFEHNIVSSLRIGRRSIESYSQQKMKLRYLNIYYIPHSEYLHSNLGRYIPEISSWEFTTQSEDIIETNSEGTKKNCWNLLEKVEGSSLIVQSWCEKFYFELKVFQKSVSINGKNYQRSKIVMYSNLVKGGAKKLKTFTILIPISNWSIKVSIKSTFWKSYKSRKRLFVLVSLIKRSMTVCTSTKLKLLDVSSAKFFNVQADDPHDMFQDDVVGSGNLDMQDGVILTTKNFKILKLASF